MENSPWVRFWIWLMQRMGYEVVSDRSVLEAAYVWHVVKII